MADDMAPSGRACGGPGDTLPDNHPTEGAQFLANVLHVPAQVVQAALNVGGYAIWPDTGYVRYERTPDGWVTTFHEPASRVAAPSASEAPKEAEDA